MFVNTAVKPNNVGQVQQTVIHIKVVRVIAFHFGAYPIEITDDINISAHSPVHSGIGYFHLGIQGYGKDKKQHPKES